MGCFSFLCKNSNKPALSTSFDGSPCRVFLLKDGKVIEEMHGNYNSYGGVFKTSSTGEENEPLRESFEWNMPWGEVCNLMFKDNDDNGRNLGNSKNGIAVILDKYWDGNIPSLSSADDPNQGWGGGGEDEDDVEEYSLFADHSSSMFDQVKEPYHKIYINEGEIK